MGLHDAVSMWSPSVMVGLGGDMAALGHIQSCEHEPLTHVL